MTTEEHKSSNISLTEDTPYLTLMGELWGVYCENFGENRPRYNGISLYLPWDYARDYVRPMIMNISPALTISEE